MPLASHYDVVVIGGGPAGAAIAIALRHAGFSVAVLEAAAPGKMRFGETLAGSVIRPLSQLGVWELFLTSRHQPAPAINSVWGSEDIQENSSIWDPYGPGWHIDRIQFDLMLSQAARQSGAAIHYGARVHSCTLDSRTRWHVSARGTYGAVALTAETLIDATGRPSWLARHLGVGRRIYDRLMAIVAFGEETDSDDSRTVIESCPDGWWYCATLPHGRSVAAFFTDGGLMKGDSVQRWHSWSDSLRRTRAASAFLPGITPSNPLWIVSAATAMLDRVTGDGWLAVGDAACSIDPLSGQGIESALNSALAAARAIAARHDGKAGAFKNYELTSRLRFQNSRIHQAKSYSQERRWCASSFWSRRHVESRVEEPGTDGLL